MIDIATLAKQTGIPAHTLRYYETRGLIAPVSRSGLKRVFADDVVLKLQLIQLGQQVGMSLDDINAAFGLNADMTVKRTAWHNKRRRWPRKFDSCKPYKPCCNTCWRVRMNSIWTAPNFWLCCKQACLCLMHSRHRSMSAILKMQN